MKKGFGNSQDERWLFRIGGISAIVLTVGYFLTFPVYAWVGDAPSSGVEAQLQYFANHGTGWWIILGLMVFTDLLYIPIFLALYQSLKSIHKSLMILALACEGLFVALDLSLTWTSYSALILSGIRYTTAAADAQRAAVVAAAGYPSALLESPLLGTYAILIPSLGILLTGLVMQKGVFYKFTAYLALATGITGILFITSYFVDFLGILRIFNALLAMIWFFVIGIRLYRLSRQTE